MSGDSVEPTKESAHAPADCGGGDGDAAQADGAASSPAARGCGAAGCSGLGTKLCTRCGVEAYCSAECQRKAWKAHKLVCKPVETPESQAAEMLRVGRLYSAKVALARSAKPSAALEGELEERAKMGIYVEIIGDSLRLEPIEGFGVGYVANRDLKPGEPLMFDTAFVSAPLDGDKEFHFLITEKALRKGRNVARRTSARADQQADFFHDKVKALELKGTMDRQMIEGTESLDEDQREQMILCAIAEGNCLPYVEESGQRGMGLYVSAARFNHSCAPNAEYESTKSSILIKAEVDIPKGTEVTISYLPRQLLSDGASRRQRLLDGRGFGCRCPRCIADGLGTEKP